MDLQSVSWRKETEKETNSKTFPDPKKSQPRRFSGSLQDQHPDAHAVRLKLALATAFVEDLTMPFELHVELESWKQPAVCLRCSNVGNMHLPRCPFVKVENGYDDRYRQYILHAFHVYTRMLLGCTDFPT